MITDAEWAEVERRLGRKLHPAEKHTAEGMIRRQRMRGEPGPHLHFEGAGQKVFTDRFEPGQTLFRADFNAGSRDRISDRPDYAEWARSKHLKPHSQNSDGSYTITDLPRR